jgi:TolA-binding protein
MVAAQCDEPSPAVPNAAGPDESETDTTIAPSAAPHPKRKVGSAGRASAAPIRPTNAELQLLRAARQDVTRGDFAGALTAIAEHTHRFRNGALVEEREALRVKSLAGLGRHEDAQRAAAQFHARFPHSVLLSTFERMKETDR